MIDFVDTMHLEPIEDILLKRRKNSDEEVYDLRRVWLLFLTYAMIGKVLLGLIEIMNFHFLLIA